MNMSSCGNFIPCYATRLGSLLGQPAFTDFTRDTEPRGLLNQRT